MYSVLGFGSSMESNGLVVGNVLVVLVSFTVCFDDLLFSVVVRVMVTELSPISDVSSVFRRGLRARRLRGIQMALEPTVCPSSRTNLLVESCPAYNMVEE
jgi:hypothetical protein